MDKTLWLEILCQVEAGELSLDKAADRLNHLGDAKPFEPWPEDILVVPTTESFKEINLKIDSLKDESIKAEDSIVINVIDDDNSIVEVYIG